MTETTRVPIKNIEKDDPQKQNPSFELPFGKFCATFRGLFLFTKGPEKKQEEIKFYKEQTQKIECIKKIFDQAIAAINTVNIDLLVLEFNNLQIRLGNLRGHYNRNRKNTKQDYFEQAVVDYYQSRAPFFQEKPCAPPSIKIPRSEIINEYLIFAQTISQLSGEQTCNNNDDDTSEVRNTISIQLKEIQDFFKKNAPNPVFLSKINL